MTEVIFRFHNPDGTPRIDTTFEVVFRRAGMVDDEDCVVVPETYTAVTDSEGVFTMSLEPASAPYRVTMIDPEADPDEDSCCGCSVSYQFYVPDSPEPVQAQDLFIAPPPRDVTWDEVAMEKLGQAVTEAEDAATEAAASAAAAEASSEGVEEYYLLAQEEAGKAAVSASESLSNAQDSLGSANAAAGSATAADTARAAAVVAKEAAEAAATDAQTAVGNLEPRVDQLELDVDAAQLSANNAAAAAATADGKAVTAQNTANAAKQVTDKLSALPTGINASYAYTIGANVNTHSWTALGTAAVANLTTAANDTTSGRAWRTNDLVKQTSASDTTAGRVLTNGAYGWGGTAPVLDGNDYNNDSEYSGLVRNNNAVAAVNYPPQLGSPNVPFAAINARFNTSYGWQLGVQTTGPSPTDASTRAFLRCEVNGTWGNWTELWHTLNLVKQTSNTDATAGAVLTVGAGGLLGTSEDLGSGFDWNNLGGPSRLVRGALNSTVNGPFADAVWLTGLYIALDPSGNNGVFHGSVVSNTTVQHFSRSKAGGMWYGWAEEWHSSNFNPALKANLAAPSFTGTVNMNGSLHLAGALEVGRTDGVASTPFVDFHAGATAVDFDARIICDTPTGVSGAAKLTYLAGVHVFSGLINGTLNGPANSLAGDHSDWATYRGSSVANMLGWKNFGNNHVIFDASQGTAPNGVAVSNINTDVPWAVAYPNLMGWNGLNTYGLRVDSSRVADQCADTGPITLSLVNGFTHGDEWLQLRRVGNVVYLSGTFKRATPPDALAHIATIPNGYRPAKYGVTMGVMIADNFNWLAADVQFQTNGNIIIGFIGVPSQDNCSWTIQTSWVTNYA